nr:slit homolog 1 protein [Misgurnus anguillicaudatus]
MTSNTPRETEAVTVGPVCEGRCKRGRSLLLSKGIILGVKEEYYFKRLNCVATSSKLRHLQQRKLGIFLFHTCPIPDNNCMVCRAPGSSHHIMLLSITLLFLHLSPSRSSRLCSHLCLCYEHSDLVDCHARGLDEVPHGLPHGTWLLDLGGNKLPVIRSRAFAGLWSLRILVLSGSGIQDLQTHAFYSLSYLEKLDLSQNMLTRIPPHFSESLSSVRELRLDHNALVLLKPPGLEHLENLEKLDLSHNRIHSLEPGTFRGLSRLRQLYLQGNRLGVVRDGSLTMLPGLEVLLLGNNNISRIEVNALAPLHSLSLLGLEGNHLEHLNFKTFLSLHTAATHLQLAGNPWSCDCDLHRVFSKLLSVRHLHVDDYDNVTCHEPWQLAGASLAWVDSQLCMAETVTVLVITVTVIVTVFGALLMAERKRKKRKHWQHTEDED